MKKYLYPFLLILSVLLLFLTIMGMLGLVLDEQLMILDPVNDLSKSEVDEFYYYYNIKTLILVLLFILLALSTIVSFYKIVKIFKNA